MKPTALFLGWICLFSLASMGNRPQQAGITPTPGTGTADPAGQLVISSPVSGQPLQGVVTIQGSSTATGFLAADISFAYASHPTGTWFPIQELDAPVTAGELARWDTTTLTDGNYDLRLTVTLQDGAKLETIVKAVRVRNYSPVETSTPTPVIPTATQKPGEAPLPTNTPLPSSTPPLPTATPLPRNPAEVTHQDLAASLGKGALTALGLFAAAALYLRLKGLHEHRD